MKPHRSELDIVVDNFVTAAQDLAYAARRASNLADLPMQHPRVQKFHSWMNMVVEVHRRSCERLGVDTKRERPFVMQFPLSEEQIHMANLNDARVAYARRVIEMAHSMFGTLSPEDLAALIFYAIDNASKPSEVSFEHHSGQVTDPEIQRMMGMATGDDWRDA